MAHVVTHLSLGALEERVRAAPDARSARHFQAIWLLAKGHQIADVASVTAFGVRWIEKLLARYNGEGPDALGDRRRRNGTSPTILTQDVVEKLRELGAVDRVPASGRRAASAEATPLPRLTPTATIRRGRRRSATTS